MPARRGQPGPPRPNNGRPPALVEAATVLRERVSHWLANDTRAARIETATLGELLRAAIEIIALVSAELDRREAE
jgi:predicted RNA-binding Zn ribbon-like protein